jgi:hypothetical protein
MLVRYDGYARVECEIVKYDGTWTDIVWRHDDKDGDRYDGMKISALTEKLYRDGDEVPSSAMADLASLMFTGRKVGE